jgi:ankyrin repeat protein
MISAENGHLEVVNALLEAGGRELLMLTRDDGASCLMISAQNGHLEVVDALLEAGGRELLMLTMNNGLSCLSVARRANQGEVFRVLEVACQNAGLSSHEITILKR